MTGKTSFGSSASTPFTASSKRAPQGKLKLRRAVEASIEALERRQLLAQTFWVNDNWSVENDVAPTGLSAGDTVANTGFGDDGQVSEANLGVNTLTFGTNAFGSIDNAVAAASSGDTIRVLSGVYTATSTINKPNLQVLGGTPSTLGDFSGIDKSTIDGRDSTRDPATSVREALIINGGSITVSASGVTVSGFTFRDNSFGAPLSIQATGSTVQNNVYTGNVYGLDIAGNNANVHKNYFVQNNAAGTNRSQGINVNGGATGVNIHLNTLLTHNNAGATRPAAVVVQGTNTSATINNNFIAKGRVGVRVGSLASAIVTNNNFEGGAHDDNSTDIVYESGAGSPGAVTGNTLAGTEYIRNLSSQDVTALVADANTYKRSDAVVETDDYAIENRIFHQVDSSTSGLVTWVANTIFVNPTVSPTPTNNNYTRIANAADALYSGATLKLSGTFDWTEPNAASSWSLGNDAVSGNNDDNSVLVPGGLTNVTITASSLGNATITNAGVGDIATANLEGVFYLDEQQGDYHNLKISNLELFDFDLGIGAFFDNTAGGGGSDAFDGVQILNNHIKVARDLNAIAAPADVNQNIGIHYSFGANQLIQGNTIDLQGDAISSGTFYASSIGMQSNTSGGAVYDGLTINNNTINVYGAQDATNPGVILGIWENAHGHSSDISVTNNDFINHDAGNNPATNLQRAFRVTSHSSATTTVTYSGNTAGGANIGFQWLTGQNFAGNQAVEVTGNTLTKVYTGLQVSSNGSAHLSDNVLDNSAMAAGNSVGVRVDAGSSAVIDAAVDENEIKGFEIGIKVLGTATIDGNAASIHGNLIGIDVDAGTATISGNHIYDNTTGIRLKNGGSASITSNDFDGATDNVTDLLLEGATSSVTGALTGNDFAGSTFFIDNQSNNDITAIATTAVPAGTNTYTETNNYRIEDKIHHAVDTDLAVTNGLVTWNANDVYVTDAGTDHSIQRGVDVASAGDTVNVEAGTYLETVAIGTANVTVLGSGSGSTTIDYTGLSGTGNGAVFVAADDVTFKGFSVTRSDADSAPRYGVKVDLDQDGVTIDDLNVSNSYRTGLDLHGNTNLTVSNVNSHDNGGAGIFMTDVKGAAFSNITTSNNPWTGVSVATSGQYAALGTNGIVFAGANSFGESAGDNGGLQLEKFNYATNTPSVITWSTVPGDNADVTILPADFSHALSGLSFDGGTNTHEYVRFYNTLGQAQTAAAGSPDHIDPVDRFIRTTNGLTEQTTYKIYDTVGDKMSINAAVVDSKNGDVVTVGAGTFNEAVAWNKNVNIIGSGSGANPAVDTIVSKLTSSPIFTVTGSGASNASPLLLQDIRITPAVVNGLNVPSSIQHLKFDNVSVIGTGVSDPTENEAGLWVNPTASIDDLVIVDSKFNDLTYGVLIQKHGDWGLGTSNVSNVSIEDTEFDNNAAKGIYAEKLTDATFTNAVVTDNGWDTAFFNAPFNAGIDINLKGEVTYENLVFNNLTVTGNALGAANGVGLTVKARGGAGETNPDYLAHPAALDGVQINGGTFTGNQNGIRIGEPGKANPSPTNVVISGSANVSNNTVAGLLLVGGQTKVVGGIVTGNAVGISVESAKAFIEGVDLSGNTVGVRTASNAQVDAGSDSGAGDPDLSGFGHSTGGNIVTGYSGLGGSYSFENLNLVASSHPKVYARANNFGPLTNTGIENTIKDDTDSATLTQVVFSQVPPVTTPTIVYVNDDWNAVANGIDADPGNGVPVSGTIFGYDQFLTLTDAIAAVDTGGTVVVFGGSYDEAVIVNKAGLTLESRQDPNVVPETQANVTRTSGTNSVVMEVTADDVTIDGFHIVVNRPNSTVGIGASNDASATFSGGTFDDLVVKNNTITVSGSGGTVASAFLTTTVSGIALVGNGTPIESVELDNNSVTIAGAGADFQRRAVWLREVEANVHDNTLSSRANDLIVQFSTSDSGTGDTFIDNNTFLSGGVDLTENASGGEIHLTNNDFNIATPSSAQSLLIKHVVAAPVEISGNTFAGHTIGVSMGNSTDVIFDDNEFTPGAAANTADIIFDTGNFTGGTPSAPFSPVSASLTNNTFHGRAGAGDTAIALWNRNPGAQSPDYGAMTIGTLGNENTFEGDVATAIYLDPGTFGGVAVTKNLDAQDNKFEVVTGTPGTYRPDAMALSQRFEVEDKITHAIDVPTLGFVTVVPDQYFVTTNSFLTGFTPAADIQRGVDLAGTTDTVHVAAGTYLNDLYVGPGKEGVQVLGAGSGTTTINYEAQPGVGNGGVYINADDVTFKGFAVTQTTVDSTPRYGVKVDFVDDVTIDDVNISKSFRSGLDLHGVTDVTVNNVNSHNNGGAGIFMTDVKGAAISNITTSANSWTGVSVSTSGRYAPSGVGTDNVVFSGINSFGESASDNGGLQLEGFEYNNPPSVPSTSYPITWSKRPSDNANVTILSADFGFALSGHVFDGIETYVRFYNSLAQAESAAVGAPDHIVAGSRFVQEADDSNGLPGSTVTNFFVFDNSGNTPIQAAVDAAVPNDYINVAAGTYSENVTVNKHVTIDGAGSGSGAGDTVVSKLSNTPIFTITGSGASNASPLLLKDLRITPVTVHGLDVPNATSVSHLKLDNVAMVGTGITDNSEAETGLWVNTTGSIDDLTVTNSKFDDLTYGWYLQKHGDWGVSSSNVTDVVVSSTQFSGNRVKGLYAEKLSDATFTGVTVSGNGLDTGFFNAPFNAGFDINLKGEALYQNLAFNNLTVTGNAIGAANGVGLTVKARGGAGESNPDYVAHPATVSNVTVTGGSYTGNQNAIRFGEPGKSNPSPTGVVVSSASITGNAQNGVMVVGGQVQLDNNTITGNPVAGVVAAGGNATIEDNDLNGNAVGVLINDGSKVDLGQTGPGTNFTGAGVSTGGNDFSGYTTTATSSAGAIVDLKTLAPQDTAGRKGIANGDVPAFGNTWAVATPTGIENVVYHDSDNPALGFVDFATFSNLVANPSALAVNEGGSITVSGSFENVPQAHTVTISWGDGTPNTVIPLTSGTFSFTSAPHTYTDDQNGPINTTNRPVTITVKEDATPSTLSVGPYNVVVSNVAPSVVVNGSAATIDEGGAYSVTFGAVTDPGTDTPQLVGGYAIDFGDGNFVTVDANSLPINGPGTYLSPVNYDGPQTYTIRVRVVDEDGPFTAGTTTVDVNNLDPTTDGFVAASPSVEEGTSNTVFWLTPSDPSVDDAGDLRFDYDINGDGDYNDAGIDIIGSSSPSANVPGSQNLPGTHYVNSRMYDNDGIYTNPSDPNDGYVLATTSYTVTAATFRVSSVTANSSGFDIVFNHKYARKYLNMYGADPSDVIVQQAGNTIPGSLVYTNDTTLTFVATGGTLSGSYSLRLKSGSATALTDNLDNDELTGGGQLDGNSNGTAGDDYFNSSINVSSAGRVISIPDFARGPGQEIDLPANSPTDDGEIGMPLKLSDAKDVRGVQFTLNFDPAKFSIKPADLELSTAASAAGWQVVPIPGGQLDGNGNILPGTIIIVNHPTTPTSLSNVTGPKDVLILHGRVPDSMTHYGQNRAIRFNNVILSIFNGVTTVPTAARGDVALHSFTYIGDTDRDAEYTSSDISNIATLAVLPGFYSFDNHPGTDPVIIGDIENDLDVTVNDVNLMTNEVLLYLFNDASPEIPAIPPGNLGNAPLARGSTTVSMPTKATIAADGSVVLPLRLEMDATDRPALTFELTYDPAVQTFSEATGATLSQAARDAGLQYAVRLVNPGQIRVVVFKGGSVAKMIRTDLMTVTFGQVKSTRPTRLLSTTITLNGGDYRRKTALQTQKTTIGLSKTIQESGNTVKLGTAEAIPTTATSEETIATGLFSDEPVRVIG